MCSKEKRSAVAYRSIQMSLTGKGKEPDSSRGKSNRKKRPTTKVLESSEGYLKDETVGQSKLAS